MLSTLPTFPRSLKLLSIPLISLALTACGGGGSTITITTESSAKFNGDWQSACTYNNSSDLSSIETLYISGTDYTIYVDEFDNGNCFGSSDFTTEIEGHLYFGDYKPYASNYCEDTIEVDFVPVAVFEDNIEIPPFEINAYLNLPEGASYNLMCTRNGELFTGDISFDDGTTENLRPLSMNYNNPLEAIN